MAEKTYHISDSGVLVECKAKKKTCPKGRHFTNLKEGQAYADRKNRAEALPNGSTESKLKYEIEFEDLFKKQNFHNQIKNMKWRIANPTKYKARKYYYKKSHQNKSKTLEEFNEWFTGKNLDRQVDYEKKRLKYMKTKVEMIIEQQEQAKKIKKDNEKNIISSTPSGASGSFYMIMKEESLEETISYFENNNYEVIVRPDIEVALVENFQVRISDHEPPDFLRSKDRNDIDKVWKHTDASILVTYKDSGDLMTDKEMNTLISRYKS